MIDIQTCVTAGSFLILEDICPFCWPEYGCQTYFVNPFKKSLNLKGYFSLEFSRNTQSWQCCQFCIAYVGKCKIELI